MWKIHLNLFRCIAMSSPWTVITNKHSKFIFGCCCCRQRRKEGNIFAKHQLWISRLRSWPIVPPGQKGLPLVMEGEFRNNICPFLTHAANCKQMQYLVLYKPVFMKCLVLKTALWNPPYLDQILGLSWSQICF